MAKLSHHRFLAVLGSSGSGKSSLVLAGLLPSLHSGFMTSAGSKWKIACMRPGDQPIQNLALALMGMTREDNEGLISSKMMLLTALKYNSTGLNRVANELILNHDENLLLVVDQFEEIFRYENKAGNSLKANSFVQLILNASQAANSRVYVIITMRSDFLLECPRFPGLPEAINKGLYLMPRMTRDQIREAITGPAIVVYEKISPILEVHLLNDLEGSHDQLPILAHSLMRTWEHWETHKEAGAPIDLDDYEAVGGMRDALNRHADEIYQELATEHLQTVCKKVFKSLTTIGQDNRGVRRPCTVRQLCLITQCEQCDVIQVLDAFRSGGRSFITPDSGPLGQEALVDISHESFMRVWKKLVGWVEEEWESAEMYRRLDASRAYYQNGEGDFLRGPALEIALDWQNSQNPTQEWASQYGGDFPAVINFLISSLRNRQEEEERENERIHLEQHHRQQKEKLRRNKRSLVLMAIMIGISILLAIYSFKMYRHSHAQAEIAKQNEMEANAQKREVEKQKEAVMAQKVIADQQHFRADSLAGLALADRDRADMEAMKARSQEVKAQKLQLIAEENEQKARMQEAQATRQKSEAILQKQEAILQKARADTAVNLFRAQKAAALSLSSSEPDRKAVFALLAFRINQENHGDPGDPNIHAAMTQALFEFSPEQVTLSGEPIRKMTTLPGRGMIFLGNHSQLGYFDGQIIKTGYSPRLQNLDDRILTVSKSGEYIAISNIPGNIYLCSNQTFSGENPGKSASAITILKGHSGAVTAAEFSPDGNTLYSAGLDGQIFAWKLEGNDNSDPHLVAKGAEQPYALASTPGGELLAIGYSNGEIKFLSTLDYTEKSRIQLRARVTSLHFHPTGKYLAAGLENGEVVLVRSGKVDGELNSQTIGTHGARVSEVLFSPDGEMLASSGYDKLVHLYRISDPDHSGIIFAGHSRWITGLAFDPSGSILYSGSEDKTIRQWFTDSRELAEKLAKMPGREISEEELKQILR
ncbi:MAG: hypothetical protein H6581_03825 [Bacteroidia bacterium]|nr:hypothetical protein [Bacteroidia bacterium]